MDTFFYKKKYELNGIVLDKYQSRAVFCNKKNYLVVAGAGSGKTLTIVAKVDYLLKNNVKNDKILCISFTNETVNNLKNKISYNVDILTFHKLALNIIKDNKQYFGISPDNLLKYIVDEFFNSYF